MKKIFLMSIFAIVLGLSFTSCGDDEPIKTMTPVITYEVQETEVIVTATGNGDVLLFKDGEQCINPTSITRGSENVSITFTATAQEQGKSISDEARLVIEIPKIEKTGPMSFVSEYESETETHFMFDIDMAKDSSSIYMYNVVFHIGEATSPAMTLRVDAPVTVDQSNKVYTYAGTGIVAYMQRGGTWLPMPGEAYLVNNLKCTVNTSAKTYDIAFDCHGGHFAESGKLK